MVTRVESDFLAWTSFPSSLKLIGIDESAWSPLYDSIPVKGVKLRIEVNVKQRDVLYHQTHIHMDVWNGKEWKYIPELTGYDRTKAVWPIPFGTFNWTKFATEESLPMDAQVVRFKLVGGYAEKGKPGTVWWDDLRIFQNGELIYENKFSNWKPVGAVAGAVIGGVAGGIYKPIGPIVSPLVMAVTGLGLGYGAGAVAMVKPGSCPVCGSEVADKPLGEDVLCPSCGFVSTWSR